MGTRTLGFTAMVLGVVFTAAVPAGCDDATNDNPPISGAAGQIQCVTLGGTGGAATGAGGTGGTTPVNGGGGAGGAGGAGGTGGNDGFVACSSNGVTGGGSGAGAVPRTTK